MRKFKTAGKKRTNYIYYTAEGRKVEITPNEDGMDETWITLLHGMDDEEVNAERRDKRSNVDIAEKRELQAVVSVDVREVIYEEECWCHCNDYRTKRNY